VPTILQRLPVSIAHVNLTVQGEVVRIKPYQIPLWISLTLKGLSRWDAKVPRFPALLDTAHNHNFSIQQRHLNDWA
jgi:hypothetical protein